METTCIRHTELPHTSRLFSDFLYHFDRVEKFYGGFGKTGSYPEGRRTALVEALREQNGDSAALDLLAEPGTVAYVTGQQVGLFSGPAYTIYKALTAVKLAKRSTEQGTPAVAIFWLATEDHDFAEVNHAWVFDAANHPVPLRVDRVQIAEQPVGEIAIPAWPLEELRAALGDLPFAGEVMDLAAETYRSGQTMGRAFQSMLAQILGRHGVLFLDPLQPSIRKIAAPLLREAVRIAPELKELLLDRNKALESAGYHAQVHVEPKTSLFFLLKDGRRLTLKRQNGGYVSRERTYSPEELAGQAEHISPNALLRPVVQDYILPTAAYIGGPAELAYMAQSQVIYERLLGYAPRLIPRSGFTILEARVQKLLERYHLRLQDFFHGEDALREKVAATLVPPGLQQKMCETSSAIAKMLADLHSGVNAFDPSLAASLEKSRAKIAYQMSKAEAKVAREALRRNDRAAADAQYLYDALVPHKHLQERFYSILPFLAKHGFDVVDRLYENVQLECPDHILLAL